MALAGSKSVDHPRPPYYSSVFSRWGNISCSLGLNFVMALHKVRYSEQPPGRAARISFAVFPSGANLNVQRRIA
jgi:hypothetical protein